MDKQKTCPRCGSAENQNKHTSNTGGSVRYRCRKCGKTYTPKPIKPAYSDEERTQTIKAYCEYKSGRAAGRLMKMDRSNSVRRIKERTAEAYNHFGEYKAKNQTLVKHKSTSGVWLHKYAELPLAFADFL